MNALTLQDLLKYRIIGHSSFQNLDFLVATSFVPPSVSSKYIAYFIPSWKKYHSKLCHCRMCSSWAAAVGISHSYPVVHFSFMTFYLVSVFCCRQIWIPGTSFSYQISKDLPQRTTVFSVLFPERILQYQRVSFWSLLRMTGSRIWTSLTSSCLCSPMYSCLGLFWHICLFIFPASSSFSLPWLGH